MFVKHGVESKFLVSPRPLFISDITIGSEKLDFLMQKVMQPEKSEFEVGPNIVYSMGKSLIELDIEADAFWTPILYC